ncbi:uncharacterized protein [Ptychodera flava]|uniref:uncharacterized protein n=1 Tax=Ptychodera flava TaxID=63121 RepID=UPI003969C431
MEEQYIPVSKKCVHAINDILSVISESFQNTQLEFMSKHLKSFGDMLDQLVTTSEKNKIVRQKAYTAVFKIKNSLQDILDESRIHRYSHEQCQELLKRLEDTIKFEQMEIGIFLEKHGLTEYSKLFDAERIMYAGELVDAYDELLELVKPNMKIGSYARYRKSVTKEKKSRDYIETELQGDLEKLERQFTEASGKIGAKLSSFLEDLEPVVDELSQVIKDETKRREIYIGLAVSGVVVLAAAYGAFAIPYLVCGIKGLIGCFGVGALLDTVLGGLSVASGCAAVFGTSYVVY